MVDSQFGADLRRIASALVVVGVFFVIAIAVSACVLALEHAGLIQRDAIVGYPIYKLY